MITNYDSNLEWHQLIHSNIHLAQFFRIIWRVGMNFYDEELCMYFMSIYFSCAHKNVFYRPQIGIPRNMYFRTTSVVL